MFENRQELVKTILKEMEDNQITVIDAIIHISEKHSIDIETMALYIKQAHKIKEQIKVEATQLKMLK